jgi:hypothetical protein
MQYREVSVEELQSMLQRGEISTSQFTEIMIKYIGKDAFMKAFNTSLEEYFKDFKLTKEKTNENAVQD